MKTKTIKTVLKKKIEDWVNSITDLEVRKAVEKDSIVTGGAIASMLLGEQVNDFDIYFKTRESLLLVSKYYIDMANKRSASISILNGGETINDDDSGQYIRAVNSMEKGQVKLFIGKDKGMEVLKYDDEYLKDHKYLPVAITPNAISLTDDIQVVVRFWGEVKQIHKNYDFVHATNSYTYGNKELNIRKPALESLLTKELIYIGSKYPVTSIIRSKKFILRGFTINAGQYLKICYQISQLDLNDLAVLEEQLIGVDIAYFQQLLTALRGVEDKKKFNYPYVSSIIDKIFQ